MGEIRERVKVLVLLRAVAKPLLVMLEESATADEGSEGCGRDPSASGGRK
jgi:hypothetical protein